jgi:Cytochrome c oxidase assembly protein CtaG/Cox11
MRVNLDRGKNVMKLSSAFLAAVLLLAPGLQSEGADASPNLRDPTRVIEGYVRAIYARDYIDAYRYISSADQRVRDVNRYARQRGAFMGSALEITRRLAGFIEISPSQKQIAPNRIQAVTKLGIPEPSKLSPLLLNLDLRRLNALETRELAQIIESLDQKKRDGSFEKIEIEEKFELVKEGDEWRIFLNWAVGVKIPFRLVLANAADLDVALSKNEVVVQPGDFFEIDLKIKNRSAQQVVARIGHLIEPRDVTNFLDFVECGFLLPVTLEPGKEHAYSARYLLRDNIPEGVRQLSLTYDFRLLK